MDWKGGTLLAVLLSLWLLASPAHEVSAQIPNPCPATANVSGPFYPPYVDTKFSKGTITFQFSVPRVYNRTFIGYLGDATATDPFCTLSSSPAQPVPTYNSSTCADVYSLVATVFDLVAACPGWNVETDPTASTRTYTNTWYLVVSDQVKNPANLAQTSTQVLNVQSPVRLVVELTAGGSSSPIDVAVDANVTFFLVTGMSREVRIGGGFNLVITYDVTTVRDTAGTYIRSYTYSSLASAPSYYVAGSASNIGQMLSCGTDNRCLQQNSLSIPVPAGTCDASGSYSLALRAKCTDGSGNSVSVPGVDCSIVRQFPFAISLLGLCTDFNKTIDGLIATLLTKQTYNLAERIEVKLTMNTMSSFYAVSDVTSFWIDALKVENKHGANFTIIQNRVLTTDGTKVNLTINESPYVDNDVIQMGNKLPFTFLPVVAIDGLILPSEIYDLDISFKVFLEMTVNWMFLPERRKRRSLEYQIEPRQFLPAPSPTRTLSLNFGPPPPATATPTSTPTVEKRVSEVGASAKFSIQPAARASATTSTSFPTLVPTQLAPITETPVIPDSSMTVWLPPIVIIIGVIAGLQGLIVLFGLGGSAPTGGNVPSTIDIVQATQTIVISGAIGLGTTDVYPIFSSAFLWLFGIFKFLNPLAEAVYADGIVYGMIQEPAALYRRASVQIVNGIKAPTYYGIERVAIAGGIRPRNLFLIILISFLFFEALMAVLGLASAILARIAVSRRPSSEKWHRFRDLVPSVWVGMSLRIWNLYYVPIVLGASYQFLLSSRPELKIPLQVTIIAAISCVVVIAVVPATVLTYVLRTDPREDLFGREELLASLGPLYNTYQPQLLLFFSAVIIYKLAVGTVSGAAIQYPWVQLAILAISEVFYMLLIASLKPHARPLRNGFELFMCVVRLVNLGLLCALVPGLGMPENVRNGTEMASMVLQMFVVVAMGLAMLATLVGRLVRWLRSGPSKVGTEDKKEEDEKEDSEKKVDGVLEDEKIAATSAVTETETEKTDVETKSAEPLRPTPKAVSSSRLV